MRIFAAFLYTLLAVPCAAQNAHWTQLPCRVKATIGTDYQFVNNYFFNSRCGFVFSPPQVLGVGNPPMRVRALAQLTRTTDGGISWTPIPFFDTLQAKISQIFFVGKSHGYIAAFEYLDQHLKLPAGGIYETFDTGTTWKRITPKGESFSSIYVVDGRIYAARCEDGSAVNLWHSMNDGATWDSVLFLHNMFLGTQRNITTITGNRDSLLMLLYIDSTLNNYLIYSTDQGYNWRGDTLDPNYPSPTPSIFGYAHSKTMLRQSFNELRDTDDTYTFTRSSAPFAHWDSSLHAEAGMFLSGTACATYTSEELNGDGVYRTTDQGLSWKIVNGPFTREMDDDGEHHNISAVGYGAVVYMSDANARLWKTTDGGDGTLSIRALAPRLDLHYFPKSNTIDTIVLYACDTTQFSFSYQNTTCSFARLTDLSIDGLDSQEYSFGRIHQHPDYSLPDTTNGSITPLGPGLRNVQLHGHFIDDEFETTDTTISLVLQIRPGSPSDITIYTKPLQIEVVAGEQVSIPVYCATSLHLTLPPTSISLAFDVQPNIFSSFEFIPALAAISSNNVTLAGNTLSANLQSTSALHLDGETILGWLSFVVSLTDSSKATIVLPEIVIGPSGPHCLAQLLPNDTVRIMRLPRCGDSTILHFMHGTLPQLVESITPNPGKHWIAVQLNNPMHETFSFELFDALGVLRNDGFTSDETMELNVNPLTAGTYYLRLRSPHGGASTSRIVVER